MLAIKLCNTTTHKIQHAINTLSQNNDTDVAHYSFNIDQPILIIFGRDVAERVCY